MIKKAPRSGPRAAAVFLGATLGLAAAGAEASDPEARCQALAAHGIECAQLSPTLLTMPQLRENAAAAWQMLPSEIKNAIGDPEEFQKMSPRDQLAQLGALLRGASEAVLAVGGPEILEDIPIPGAHVEHFSAISHFGRVAKISSPALDGFAARLVGGQIIVNEEHFRIIWGSGPSLIAAGIDGDPGPIALEKSPAKAPVVVIPAQKHKPADGPANEN